jgi:hypothetical protein
VRERAAEAIQRGTYRFALDFTLMPKQPIQVPRPQPADPTPEPMKDPPEKPYQDPVETPPNDPEIDRPMRDPEPPDTDRPRS